MTDQQNIVSINDNNVFDADRHRQAIAEYQRITRVKDDANIAGLAFDAVAKIVLRQDVIKRSPGTDVAPADVRWNYGDIVSLFHDGEVDR